MFWQSEHGLVYPRSTPALFAVAVLSGSGGKSHDQTAHIAIIASVFGPDIFIRLAPSDKSFLRARPRRTS